MMEQYLNTSGVESLPRAETIARLNDKLRKHRLGGAIMITSGVQARELDCAILLDELARYDQFDADNDPHGERDFGDLQVDGTDLLWKIDYYETGSEFASPDPADPTVTRRVLTVMLPCEY